MTIRSWWLHARALFRRARVEQDLREELDFHVEMQAREHRAAGLDADEALRRARLELGNVELVKEDDRDVRGVRPVEGGFRDVCWDTIRRKPVVGRAR